MAAVLDAPPLSTPEQRRRILDLCRRIGLDRRERYELALAILGVEIRSFDELWSSGADRLLAAMVGWQALRRCQDHEDPRTRSIEPWTAQRPPAVLRSSAQHRKVMAMCAEMGLDDDQRHAFASEVLGVEVTTFQGLDAISACLLIDALSGYHAVDWLVSHPKPKR